VAVHRFGGAWTERKLAALGDYLVQFQVIFTRNPAARKLRTVYVDAFAGTGDRDARPDNTTVSLFGYGDETREFQQGSARVALELQNKFQHYVFIDSKARHISSLRKMVERDLPACLPLCEFVHEDANIWLKTWCTTQNWRLQRAVVFLDPYGMSVDWDTIAAIARTRSIDLWVLFPFAIGANRMMPSDVLPDKGWGIVLTKVFGTVDWIKRFYEKKSDIDLFGAQRNSVTKIVGADEILEFFLERLRTVFPHVVQHPMILYNSNNSPMYALCFAAGNEKGGTTALKIAGHLARTR
jgi:three-Cys-motif partner protein